jgi:hypothetical protein
MSERPYIDLERGWELDRTLDADWIAFVKDIQDLLVVRLEPLDESLTRWNAECFVKNEEGRLTGELHTVQINYHKPGKPEWLVKPRR